MLNKPHGVSGELSFTFQDDSFDREDVDFLVLLLDGIFVPFFIESYRFRSDNAAILKLEDIDTAEQARRFTNTEVYLPKHQAIEREEIETWNFFEGFRVIDTVHGELGTVAHVDESTMNVLFYIDTPDGELLLPAHEEFILDVNREEKYLTVAVPEGLLGEWEDE